MLNYQLKIDLKLYKVLKNLHLFDIASQRISQQHMQRSMTLVTSCECHYFCQNDILTSLKENVSIKKNTWL